MRALVVVLTLMLAPSALAATVLVDDSDPTPDGACGSVANRCNTIQAGISAAAVGDTVSVAPGLYNTQLVNVNKSIVLRGAKAGVDARSRTIVPADESVVTGPGGQTAFSVSANGVTIDGFLVQGNTSATQGSGIFTAANLSGLRIDNSVVRNNIAGLILGADHTVITHNLFASNNNAGTLAGTGIYTDHIQAGGTLLDLRVIENDFSGNQNIGLLVAPSASSPADDVEVRGNRWLGGEGNAMSFINTLNLTATDNQINGTAASSIVIGGGVSQAVLSGNTITNSATRGFRLGDFGGGSANSLITMSGNSVTGGTTGIEATAPFTGTPTIRANRLVGNSTAGLFTDLAGINAGYNWWGCNGGPGASGCTVVGTTGAGSATTSPWTILSLRAAPATIPASGGTTTITADLSKASDGTSNGSGVPDRTSVALATTKGTVTSPALTTSGLANGTLTADAGFGTATVTATLDNQSATTDVTVRPGDADGDGLTDDQDCAPSDPAKPAAGNVADTNCDGIADPPPTPPVDTTAPRITATTISKGRLRFTCSERALVRILVRRKKGRRFVRVAATAIIARRGRNTVTLPGRPRHNKARVVLTATDAAGNRAKALTLKV